MNRCREAAGLLVEEVENDLFISRGRGSSFSVAIEDMNDEALGEMTTMCPECKSAICNIFRFQQ